MVCMKGEEGECEMGERYLIWGACEHSLHPCC